MDIAVQLDIIQKSGSWFAYNGERIGQGRDKVKDFLANNAEIAAQVEKQVRENVDKLFAKTAPKGAAARPVEAPPAPAEAPAPKKPAPPVDDPSIDIEVD